MKIENAVILVENGVCHVYITDGKIPATTVIHPAEIFDIKHKYICATWEGVELYYRKFEGEKVEEKDFRKIFDRWSQKIGY